MADVSIKVRREVLPFSRFVQAPDLASILIDTGHIHDVEVVRWELDFSLDGSIEACYLIPRDASKAPPHRNVSLSKEAVTFGRTHAFGPCVQEEDALCHLCAPLLSSLRLPTDTSPQK